MKKFLVLILVLLSFTVVINAGFTTASSADNSQYQLVKDQSFYCSEFQGFYNDLMKAEAPLTIDGVFNTATEKAFNKIKNLVISNSEYCRKFQQFYNVTVDYETALVVDGLCGQATKNALNTYENFIRGNFEPVFNNPYLTSKEFYCSEFQGFYNDTYKYGTRLVIDGLYGPATANAYSKMRSLITSNNYYCRKFQDFYNKTVNPSKPLIIDGYIGPATLNAYSHYGTLMK